MVPSNIPFIIIVFKFRTERGNVMTNLLVFHKMNITLAVAQNQAWPFSLHRFLPFLFSFFPFPFSLLWAEKEEEGGSAFEWSGQKIKILFVFVPAKPSQAWILLTMEQRGTIETNKIDPVNLESGQPLKSIWSLPNKHVLSFSRSKNNKGEGFKPQQRTKSHLLKGQLPLPHDKGMCSHTPPNVQNLKTHTRGLLAVVIVPEPYSLEIIPSLSQWNKSNKHTRLNLCNPLLRLILLHEHHWLSSSTHWCWCSFSTWKPFHPTPIFHFLPPHPWGWIGAPSSAVGPVEPCWIWPNIWVCILPIPVTIWRSWTWPAALICPRSLHCHVLDLKNKNHPFFSP